MFLVTSDKKIWGTGGQRRFVSHGLLVIRIRPIGKNRRCVPNVLHRPEEAAGSASDIRERPTVLVKV